MTENLVLEMLRKLQGEVADIRREMREGFVQVNVQIAAIGRQVAALATAVYGGHDQINDLKRRVERIERRLELRDTE